MMQELIDTCQERIMTLQTANRHQDQSLTDGTLHYEQQKHNEIEVYSKFIETMQDAIGRDITPGTFKHTDWSESEAELLLSIVKDKLKLKDYRISKYQYEPRLKNLLERNKSYYTFQSSIITKVESLWNDRASVSRESLKGLLPDKVHFWSQLKEKNLITLTSDAKVGHWNPENLTNRFQFDDFDYISVESFKWIESMLNPDLLVQTLKENKFLDEKGQLIELDLSKPLRLPPQFTPYYKQIKDTLVNHSIYWYVVDHLRKCVIIEESSDVNDSIAPDSNPLLEPQTQQSVYDKICAMNPEANAATESTLTHISEPKSSQSLISNTSSNISQANHTPNETMNESFRQELVKRGLVATNVSGVGLNCLINTLIQHAKSLYNVDSFEEAISIRDKVLKKHPEMVGMLHADDEAAKTVLVLVNDLCRKNKEASIRTVSVVIASSDGPVIYGGTCDERFSNGRHVVIWQQGDHFVAIVDQSALLKENQEQVSSDLDKNIQLAQSEAPKLTRNQFLELQRLDVIIKTETKRYEICKGLSELNHCFKTGNFSDEDKIQVEKFMMHKLEIDFKTLNACPRQLFADQHLVIFDDLCMFGVIKGVKVKLSKSKIEDKCENKFGYEGTVTKQYPLFDIQLLNEYLKITEKSVVSDEQSTILLQALIEKKVVKEGTIQQKCYVAFKTIREFDDFLHSSKVFVNLASFLSTSQQKEIEKYLRLMIHFRENVDTIVTMIQGQRSSLLDFDTPQITFRKLADVFEDTIHMKGDVVQYFTDNQHHFIIDIAEERWSLKSILTAVSIIVIGVAQIVAGAILLAATAGSATFLCEALISEGVSDMIFGIEGLVKGYCSWKDYFTNKLISIAITVATAGVGALLARGKEVSKYFYKAFEVGKEIVEETAEVTGKSVSKVIYKEIGKKITKEVGGAVADAGINLAVEAIVDQCSNVIDKFSAGIIDCFDNITRDETLKEKMTTYLQTHPQNPEEHLHQLVVKVMNPKTFLDLLDELQDKAEKGVGVISGGYGQAAEKLGKTGGKFMSALGKFSKFAPLLSDAIKVGFVKIEMNKMKEELERELEHNTKENISGSLSDSKKKEFDAIIDKELKLMKQNFSQKMSERTRSILQKGLHLAAQSAKSRAIEHGKKHIAEPLRDHIELAYLKRLERKASDKTSPESTRKQYKEKLDKMLTRSRSPKVYARMIKNHDAELGPAFATPALEIEFGQKIRIITEDGKPLANVKHHSEGEPEIVVKFVPAKDGEPAHYYHGNKKFTPDQHGNNCLIEAVKMGANKPDISAKEVREKIARACQEESHPCYHYIRSGIARNYVKIGLIGGGPEKKSKSKVSAESKIPVEKDSYVKTHFYNEIDQYLIKDFVGDSSNTTNSGISANIFKGSTKLNLTELKDAHGKDLHRCHRFPEKYISEICTNALDSLHSDKTKSKKVLTDLRKTFLPTEAEVKSGDSAYGSYDSNNPTPAQKAFLDTYYGNSPETENVRKKYQEQIKRISDIISTGQIPPEINSRTIVTDLSNSPPNVSLGHGLTNITIGATPDYNINESGAYTPRSEHMSRVFGTNYYGIEIPRQKTTASGAYLTSFYSGQDTKEHITSMREENKKKEQSQQYPPPVPKGQRKGPVRGREKKEGIFGDQPYQ